MERSLCHQLQGLIRLLQGKDTVIHSRAHLLLFHDLGNFPELRTVRTDKDKPIFLPLLLGSLVVFSPCQDEELFFPAGELPGLGEGLVGSGA